MPLYQYIISLLCGAGFGLIVSWVPYASAVCYFLAVLSVLYVLRTAFSATFRKSHMCPVQFNVLFFAWVVIIIFIFHPTGLHTFLPSMHVENQKVSTLVDKWKSEAPNIEISCSDEILNSTVSINTITRISIDEAMDILDRQLKTTHDVLVKDKGRSIARGPHILITLKHNDQSYNDDISRDNREPYLYDGF